MCTLLKGLDPWLIFLFGWVVDGGWWVFLSCFSFYLFIFPLVGTSCIPLVYLWAPLGALLMNIFAFTHQKIMCLGLVHPTLDSRQVRDALNYKRQG